MARNDHFCGHDHNFSAIFLPVEHFCCFILHDPAKYVIIRKTDAFLSHAAYSHLPFPGSGLYVCFHPLFRSAALPPPETAAWSHPHGHRATIIGILRKGILMKKNYYLIFTATVLLAVLSLGIFLTLDTQEIDLFSVTVRSTFGTEQLKPWHNETGDFFVFLPSHADLSQTVIELKSGTQLYFNGSILSGEAVCENFSFETKYPLEYSVFGRSKSGSVTFLKSANLPTLYIDTFSGSMDAIHSKKGVEESGVLRYYSPDGTSQISANIDGINGRGNSTWARYDKKAYSFTVSAETDLLDTGPVAKYVLLANADDRSNMRNMLVFDTARLLGLAYTPNSCWVDLYLNGEYVGLYQLCNRIEINSQRGDIAHEDSVLVSMEMESNLQGMNRPMIKLNSGNTFRLHSDSASAAGAEKFLSAVEGAMTSANLSDPVSGKHLLELIDQRSWASKYLIEEVFGNIDAGRNSQFYYFDGSADESKLYAGPVWDYDHTMGNRSEWQLQAPQALLASRSEINLGYTTSWLYLISRSGVLDEQIADIYGNELRPVIEAFLAERIEQYHLQISASCRMDEIRWPQNVIGLAQEEELLLDYMYDRLAFLDRIWIDNEQYHTVKASNSTDYRAYYAVFDGENLTDLPDFPDNSTSEFIGWYYKDTSVLFDSSQPITQDTELYALWQDTETKDISFSTLTMIAALGIFLVIGTAALVIELRYTKNSRRKKQCKQSGQRVGTN